MYKEFSFSIQHTSGRARAGVLRTPHGEIQTPAFIFCATKAALKGVSPQQAKDAGAQVILANTYHLMLQPGSPLVAEMGGLHQFMGWDGPMLTDSGGFQIFSLGHGSVAEEIKGKRRTGSSSLKRISEEGALFRSYRDGAMELLTPERAITIQRELGADLILVLDECTPYHVDKKYTKASMELSHRWAQRSLEAFVLSSHTPPQALYGIVQGGVYPDLREISASFLNDQPFFGHAVGGSLGANKDQMHEVVTITMQTLCPERPVHLLGIGGIDDIFNGVKAGIDTFDCVHPTRLARHGGALVKTHYWLTEGKGKPAKEHINLKNAQFKNDPKPIDSTCPCDTCKNYSRAYLHHLLQAKEILGMSAISIHNICFMNRLFTDIRAAIKDKSNLEALQQEWSPRYVMADLAPMSV